MHSGCLHQFLRFRSLSRLKTLAPATVFTHVASSLKYELLATLRAVCLRSRVCVILFKHLRIDILPRLKPWEDVNLLSTEFSVHPSQFQMHPAFLPPKKQEERHNRSSRMFSSYSLQWKRVLGLRSDQWKRVYKVDRKSVV